MIEIDGAAMLRALAEEDALRVFAEVVVATATGLPRRSGNSISMHYITVAGLSRRTGLSGSAVLKALNRLTEAHLTAGGPDGAGWCTDFAVLSELAASPPS